MHCIAIECSGISLLTVQGLCMPASYVTHLIMLMRRAKINLIIFLTIFEYAESNPERFNYLCKNSNFAILGYA